VSPPSIRDEFDLVAIVVFEIRCVAVGSASKGMAIRMHEPPAVLFGAIDQSVQGAACSGVEGQVVEAGPPTIMRPVDQRWGLLEHDVGGSQLIAHAVVPELELLIAKGAQQPLPSWPRRGEVGYPQLDMVQQAHSSVRFDHRVNATWVTNIGPTSTTQLLLQWGGAWPDQNVRMTTPAIQLAIDNELALLTPAVRGNPSKVAALLDPEFQEIGSSGQLWSRESMISALASEPSDDDVAIEASEMRGVQLSPELILLTYISQSGHRQARRSSLWRLTSGSWQLLFHQGTPTGDR